ncbi:MAG TPA: glycosyltransferase family 2 protein [Casimicrobiaceae bacterium]|nr:glycosyltransferase family 2 protein [Casimicrobiaceae bacterium]
MDVLSTPGRAAAAIETRRFSLSVVVPLLDEEEVLPDFHRRLSAVLDAIEAESEVVYVNDGSSDRTMALLTEIHARDARVAVIELSRNFGKEVAMSAGLDAARGDAVIVIDADLQDPPELIPEMLRKWLEGNDAVVMRRRSRAQESWLKKATARVFYGAMGRLGTIEIPENVGDFRLLSRRAAAALRRFPERARFMKGLFAWIGFRSVEIEYDRDGRYAGTSKWNYWHLWNFALEGITSFSVGPLKLASYVGFLTSVAAFAFGMKFVFKTLLYGDPVAGFPTLVTLVLFLGGLQLMALGVIGEYLARMFIEVKQRPLYLVQRYLRSEAPIAAPEEPLPERASRWPSR